MMINHSWSLSVCIAFKCVWLRTKTLSLTTWYLPLRDRCNGSQFEYNPSDRQWAQQGGGGLLWPWWYHLMTWLLGTCNWLGLNLDIDSNKAQLTCQDLNTIQFCRKLSNDKRHGIIVLALISPSATPSRNSEECPARGYNDQAQHSIFRFIPLLVWNLGWIKMYFYPDFVKSQDDWLKALL